MRRPYTIFLPLLSLFLVRVDLTDLCALRYPVEIVKLYDGDTLLLQLGPTQVRLRLSKIDSPEKGQPFSGQTEDAGLASKRCLEQQLKQIKQPVLIWEKRDIYGRVLGDIEGLSFRLVSHGCTGLYPYAQFSSKEEKYRYLKALQIARRNKLGVWSKGGYLTPALWRKRKRS